VAVGNPWEPFAMTKFASIACAFLLMPSVASAQFAASQEAWEGQMKRLCPSHHVEWIPGGSYDDVIASYDAKLSPRLQREARRIADYSHRCSHETAGLSCEWAAYIDAYWKLGRLPDFAAWTCRHVKCEEAAICELPPLPSGS
jgi:hypothetical protein